ncbi:MAG: diaminopimelate epimerase [Candidatus Poribacteria bacterium]|nr:diaminopimelate epimerase [Candidatus Poribacteria bacterium]
MNKIPFMKLSGAGNDFVIINNLNQIVDSTNPEFMNFVTKVCQRRMSVGADGVLLVESADDVDFRMRYFNADGSEVETCGNGARCISKYSFLNGIVSEKMRFLTNAGIYEAEVVGDNVKVGMSDPTDIRINVPLRLDDGVHKVGFANSGVPHVVFFVDDLESTDVFDLGQQTRYHVDFKPAGTNANFIRIHSQEMLEIRTYERGVENETLACGTGSIASAIVSATLGKVKSPVSVKTASGVMLKIHFDLKNDEAKNVYLEGDARVIFAGELTSSAWDY